MGIGISESVSRKEKGQNDKQRSTKHCTYNY